MGSFKRSYIEKGRGGEGDRKPAKVQVHVKSDCAKF